MPDPRRAQHRDRGDEFRGGGRFYETVWNLRPVASGEDTRLFRGTDAYHHIVGLHRGPQPALLRIVFDVPGRDAVNALHRSVSATGLPVSAPAALTGSGGGYGFGCKDPDGRNLAFVCDCDDHPDSASEPDRPRRIAHVNLNAQRFRREPALLSPSRWASA